LFFSLLLLSNAWKPLVKNCIIHNKLFMSIARPYFPEFFEFQNSMLILYVTKRHISLTLNNNKFVPAAVIIQKKIKISNSNISNCVKKSKKQINLLCQMMTTIITKNEKFIWYCAYSLYTVQYFLIKLGISILRLYDVIVRPTKIMNRADKN
jgi:hypothetical protein